MLLTGKILDWKYEWVNDRTCHAIDGFCTLQNAFISYSFLEDVAIKSKTVKYRFQKQKEI